MTAIAAGSGNTQKGQCFLEFRVLGPLEIVHDGSPVIVSRHRCQALVALLVSRYPHAMTPDAVAEGLWPEVDPAKSINSARVHARYLRKALEAVTTDVPITAGRYAITVARDQIDATRFEDLSVAAHAAAAAGDPHRATSLFAASLAGWRGEPYGEFPEVQALRSESARLRRIRIDTVEAYASSLLDDDSPDEACRLLHPVLEDNLAHETLAARLMLALYRTGRPSEALAVLGRVKEALAESGLVPSYHLTRLANAIVTRDESLDPVGHREPAIRATFQPRRRSEFIGRADELQALNTAWDRATAGAPQLVIVSGVTGVGKSALVHRFIDDVRSNGGTVTVGRCEPDPGENFEPFPDLVRTVLATTPPTHSEPNVLRELVRLAPDLSETLPPAGPEPEPAAGRQRFFGAVATVLAMPHTPRLIVIENLHWVRPDALSMLRHLIRAASGQIMVVCTYRDRRLQRRPPAENMVLTGRLAHPDLQLDLAPMNHHEVAAMVDSLAPVELRASWIGQLDGLVAVSRGNPLAIREVLRQLERDPDAPVADLAPEGMIGLVAQRLKNLDETTQAVLQIAAVMGHQFSLEPVATAAGIPESVCLAALELAMEDEIIIDANAVDDFEFAHPLYRNAVYKNLSASRRARAHGVIGEALAASFDRDGAGGGWAEVARHLVAAGPAVDRATTARITQRAGADAAKRYAHTDAAAWYRHAVESALTATWSAHEIARLRLALGVELELSGELKSARTEYFLAADTARTIGDSALLIDAAVAATPRYMLLDQDFAVRIAELADEALGLLPPNDPARVQLIRSAAYARFPFNPDCADGFAREAERLSRRTSDPETRSLALGLKYLVHCNDDEQRLTLSRELLRHARNHNLTGHIGEASRRFLIDQLIHGNPDEFETELVALHQLSQSTLDPFDQYWVAALTATRALMQSASATTQELIDAAALLGRQLQVFETSGLQMLQLFALRYQQGRAREVTTGLSDGVTDKPAVVAGTSLLALAFAEAGRVVPARRALDRVVDHHDINLPRDNFWLGGVALFSGVAALCGSPQQRQVLRRGLAPRADRFCVFGAGGAVFGCGHHWLARMATADGNTTDARDHLAQAARICDDAGAYFWAERARSEAMETRGEK